MSHINLFGTPVWKHFVEAPEEFNRNLFVQGESFIRGMNYFDLPGDAIAELKVSVLGLSKSIAAEFNWNRQIAFIKGRQNPIHKNQIDSPHHHSSAKLVGVYYVSANLGQGDILLHDPRGATTWDDPQARSDDGKTMRSFHRITPVSGMLLLFPGYLIHSVEPNLTDDVRLSIAIEVYTEFPSEH